MAAQQPVTPQPPVGSVTRCPRCGAPASQFNRWPQSPEVWRVACGACDFAWQEASTRDARDTVGESWERVVSAFLIALAGVGVLAFVYVVFLLLKDAIGAGEPNGVELGVVLVLAFAALLLIALWQQSSSRRET